MVAWLPEISSFADSEYEARSKLDDVQVRTDNDCNE